MKRLLVGTPVKHGISAGFINCLFSFRRSLERFDVDFHAVQGQAVNFARNDLAQKAVNEGYDGLLQIDEDMFFGGEHARILEHGDKIIGGAYCVKRGGPPKWLFVPKPGASETPDGLLDCSTIATGFLYTPTSALVRIREANPEHAYNYFEGSPDPLPEPRFEWFPMGIVNKRLVGEDYGFCHLAHKAGAPVYAALKLGIVKHMGHAPYPITEEMVQMAKNELMKIPEAFDLWR